MAASIVHESEVQRQHTRYRLPVQCQFGDQSFDVIDWSVGGFAIQAPGMDISLRRVLSFRLVFPLEEYDIVLPIQGEVRNVDAGKGRIGFKFVNTSQRQIAVLRYIIDAFLSGEIVSLGDILDVTARTHAAVPRTVPKRSEPQTAAGRLMERLRPLLSYGAIAIATLALLAFVVTAVYERLFISRALSAAISIDTITIAAPVSGQLEVVTEGAALIPGAPAVAVRDWGQREVFVEAKCACPVVERLLPVGSTVTEGAPVLRAALVGAKPFVRAIIDEDTLIRIREGTVARLEFADGTITEVNLTDHPPRALGVAGLPGSASTASVVAFDPGREIPLDWYGAPVRLRFDSFGASLLGRIFD